MNNGDLISREALKKDMCKICNEEYSDEPCEPSDCVFFNSIKNAHAVDAVEVVHAKWELKHIGHGHYWECSACHTNPCIYVTENTKFCPNCGARMDKERKE